MQTPPPREPDPWTHRGPVPTLLFPVPVDKTDHPCWTVLGEGGPERAGQGKDHAGTALAARSALLLAGCCPAYKQPPLHGPCQPLSLLYPAPRALGTPPLPRLQLHGGEATQVLESRRRPHPLPLLSPSPPLLTQSPKPGSLLTSAPVTPEGPSEHPASQPRPCSTPSSGSPLPSGPHSLESQGPYPLLQPRPFLILPRVTFRACPSANTLPKPLQPLVSAVATAGPCRRVNSHSAFPAGAGTQFRRPVSHAHRPRLASQLPLGASHLLPGAPPRRSGSS